MRTAFMVVVAAMSMFGVSAVSAQTPTKAPETKTEQKSDATPHKGGRHHEDLDKRLAKMKIDLGLTDEQVVKIKALEKSTSEKLKVEGADKRVIFKAKMDEMNKILTPAQQKKISRNA